MAKFATSFFTVRVHHDTEKLSPEKLKDLIAARVHTLDGVENKPVNPNTDGASVEVQIIKQ